MEKCYYLDITVVGGLWPKVGRILRVKKWPSFRIPEKNSATIIQQTNSTSGHRFHFQMN